MAPEEEEEQLLRPDAATHGQTGVWEMLWELLGVSGSDLGFVAAFEKRYGAQHPAFYDGTFEEAAGQAQQQSKPLFVYLHSREHDDTDTFCSRVLCDEEVIKVLRDNFVVYAQDVGHRSGHEKADQFNVYLYPFSCVLVKKGVDTYGCLLRFDGFDVDMPQPGAFFCDQLHGAVSTFHQASEIARREPAAAQPVSEASSILQEQDAAYREALEQDRQREDEERQKQEEEERRIKALQLEEEKKQEEALERQERLQLLPRQPNEGDTHALAIQIRLPDGESISRRFNSSDSMHDVYTYVSCHELLDVDGNTVQQWELTSNFPRKTFSADDGTLQDSGVCNRSVLFVKESV